MAESRFTIRLCAEVSNENSLIDYLHSIPKSRRAEHIRLLLTAGYNAIVNNAPLTPAQSISIPAPQVTQPVAPAVPSYTDVAPDTQAATVQQVDPIPTSGRGQEELEIQDNNNADESECSMDATDPLAKMKAIFG